MFSATFKLTDEAVAALREAEANGVSFRDLVSGMINMASSNSGPARIDNSDIEIARGLAQARAELAINSSGEKRNERF